MNWQEEQEELDKVIKAVKLSVHDALDDALCVATRKSRNRDGMWTQDVEEALRRLPDHILDLSGRLIAAKGASRRHELELLKTIEILNRQIENYKEACEIREKLLHNETRRCQKLTKELEGLKKAGKARGKKA